MANNNKNNRNSHNLRSNNSRNSTKSVDELSLNSSIVEQLFDDNQLEDQKQEKSFESYSKVKHKSNHNRENSKKISNCFQTNSKCEVNTQQIKSNQLRSSDKSLRPLSPPHLLTRSRLKTCTESHSTVRRLGSPTSLTSLRRSTRIASTGLSQYFQIQISIEFLKSLHKFTQL